MTILETLGYAIPELILAIGGMALLIAGVFLGDGKARLIGYLSVGVLILALIVVLAVGAHGETLLFGGGYVIDSYAVFCKAVIFAALALAILMSERFLIREKLMRFEFPVLIVLAALGMALMVSANDLIGMYLGIELQALAIYILCAFNRDSRRSTEAALKYFVLGALSSGLLLYGASLVYGFTGSTGFQAIAEAAGETARGGEPNIGLVFGLVFMICGLAFKVSAAPFHMWTPDVYEGSPTPVAALISHAPKLAAMALFARVMVVPFTDILDQWRLVIIVLSLLSMVIGAVSAIAQTNIKRLMAYSAIGHMGYALMGLAAGGAQGVEAALIYMAIYVVMTIGTFACILSMRRAEGMAENISDLAGLSRSQPGMSIIMTVMFFSLAGIPPTAGFWGKWFVFAAAVDAGLVWFAVAGAVIAVVSAFYYLNVVRAIWFDEPAAEFQRDNGSALAISAGGSALLLIFGLVVFIGPLRMAAQAAAGVLF